MHGFIIFWLIAGTTAGRLGYNYQKIGPSTTIGSAGQNGNDAGESGVIDIRFGGSTTGTSNVHGSGFNGFDNSIGATRLSNGNVNNGNTNLEFNSGINNNPAHVEFNKEFYMYSAPEELFNDYDNLPQAIGSIKKNLRVIFIKAPENQAFTNAAIQLAKHASEAHTAIYVLAKQTDIGALVNQLQAIKSSHANKPEVHFVKYRTPEEALHAQTVIQSQYDSLRGPTHSSNEGLAPVLDFASSSSSSSLPSSSPSSSPTFSSPSSSLSAAVGDLSTHDNVPNRGFGLAGSSNGYLPPTFRRI